MFSEEDKQSLFERLRKVEEALIEISGRFRMVDAETATVSERGCKHGVKRYEDLNTKIEASRKDLLEAIENRMKNYKLVAGTSGIIGLLGGYVIQHI